jgi:MATE family multidrug resistance protein
MGPALARLRDRVALMRMVSVNGDIMLRTILLQGAFTAFLFLAAGLGDVPLAANQVLMQFVMITAYALDGFAFAAETLVGQAVGARVARDLDRAARLSFGWGIGGSVLMAGTFAVSGPWIIDTMTTAPEVRAAARAFLPWVVAAPVVGIASWMYDGIFIGATQTRAMLGCAVVSTVAYAAALGLLIPAFGNHGLWAALMVLNAVRGLTAWLIWPRLRARLMPSSGGTPPRPHSPPQPQ